MATLSVSASGTVEIQDSNDLTIGTVDGQAGIDASDIKITTEGTGSVTIGADLKRSGTNTDVDVDINAGGAFTLTTGVSIDAGSAMIDITAVGDLTLGGVVKTTNDTALAVALESTGGSIIDGDTNDSLDVNAAAGTLTMTADGSIGSGNPLETTIATLKAEGTSIEITETNNLLLDLVNGGTGAVDLSVGGEINDGSIKGGTVTIAATTIGLTTPVTVDVAPNDLFMTLTDENENGLSGYLVPGPALNSVPESGNIVAPGIVIIEGVYTFLSGELAGLEGALAALATVSNQQEALEALLRLAAEANFFMIPPLDLFIDIDDDDFLDEASLLNPGDLNVSNWTDGPTLLHSNSLTGTSPPLSLLPNGHEGQQLRLLASL